MTSATVTVAVVAALFLASASALSSRFVFEAQEQRILRHSATALAEAVRRGDDLSATHVARALMEKGSGAVFQVIAAIEDASPADLAEGKEDEP